MSGDSTTKADFLLRVFTYSGSVLALVFVYPLFSGIQDKAAALPGDAGASGKTAVVQAHDTPSCCRSHIEQATFYIPLAEASHMVKLPKIR